MMSLRTWSALWFLALLPELSAQVRPQAVRDEMVRLGAMLRSNPPEATQRYIDSLLALPATAKEPFLLMGLYHFKGHAFRLLGEQDQAMAAQVRAYELADSLNDHKGRMDAQMAIGIIHMDRNEIDKAKQELLEVYRLTQANPIEGNYRVPLMLGAMAHQGDQLDSALFWYGKALPLAEAERDSMTVCNILFNMAIAHKAKPDLAKCDEHLLRVLGIMPNGGFPQIEARAYEALADSYLEQQRWAEVPPLLDKAHQLAIKLGAGDILENVLIDRRKYFLATRDSAQALEVSDRLLALKDSLANVWSEEALAEARSKFDVERVEKQLALTKAEAEVNALRAQRSWIAWGALAVISVLAAVLIFTFRKQYLAKKQAALVLEQDKERLSEENEFLQQENLMARFETLKSQIDPHFLFNAMNTLYTLVETEPAKAREFVSSFSALYRKVLTSREHTIVPVKEELELVRHYLFLQRIRFGDSLKVEVNVPADKLNGYLPPFTVQMLLENAIKHNVISAAHPLHIHLGVENDRLVVRNDLRPRSGKVEGTGTGLENIRRRYALLGAPAPGFALSDAHYTATVPILSHEA